MPQDHIQVAEHIREEDNNHCGCSLLESSHTDYEAHVEVEALEAPVVLDLGVEVHV
jgi:hypothetical protein